MQNRCSLNVDVSSQTKRYTQSHRNALELGKKRTTVRGITACPLWYCKNTRFLQVILSMEVTLREKPLYQYTFRTYNHVDCNYTWLILCITQAWPMFPYWDLR